MPKHFFWIEKGVAFLFLGIWLLWPLMISFTAKEPNFCEQTYTNMGLFKVFSFFSIFLIFLTITWAISVFVIGRNGFFATICTTVNAFSAMAMIITARFLVISYRCPPPPLWEKLLAYLFIGIPILWAIVFFVWHLIAKQNPIK